MDYIDYDIDFDRMAVTALVMGGTTVDLVQGDTLDDLEDKVYDSDLFAGEVFEDILRSISDYRFSVAMAG